MKRVKRPTTVKIPNAGIFPFNDYVEWLLDTDHRLNVGRIAAKAGKHIAEQLEKGGDLFLEDTDGDLLKQASEQPSNGYPLISGKYESGKTIDKGTARYLVPYLDAIDEMKECKVEDSLPPGNGAKEADPPSPQPSPGDLPSTG